MMTDLYPVVANSNLVSVQVHLTRWISKTLQDSATFSVMVTCSLQSRFTDCQVCEQEQEPLREGIFEGLRQQIVELNLL